MNKSRFLRWLKQTEGKVIATFNNEFGEELIVYKNKLQPKLYWITGAETNWESYMLYQNQNKDAITAIQEIYFGEGELNEIKRILEREKTKEEIIKK